MKTSFVLPWFLLVDAVAKPPQHFDNIHGVISAVLEATYEPFCSFILISDDVTSSSTILKAVNSGKSSSRGFTMMEVTADIQDANMTLEQLSHLVGQARKVRLGAWCMSVVLLSHNPAFLAAFAEFSLKGRLLVWATRLLVVTSLALSKIQTLLPSYWTFSMMNTMFLNLERTNSIQRYRLYSYLPYSPDGAQVVPVAFWSLEYGIVLLTGLPLFPDKFSNFNGAKVNVTSQPWPPFWSEMEHKAPDGTVITEYSGSEYITLKTMAETLNFTINVVPTASWAEILQKVEERVSFIATAYHVILIDRWKRFGFTHTFEFNQVSFCLAKPSLKPRWQSLYYPLENQVWMAILVVLLLMPFIFNMIIAVRGEEVSERQSAGGQVVLEVTGILLGQNLPLRLPDISSSRLLAVAWLLFSLIAGTAYRGNLTAALTLPKYPPRPETLEQLVNVINRVTMPSFGEDWRKFFAASNSKVYKRLAELLFIGPSIKEGLHMATEQNSATVTGRRYLANMIAEHFTEADGSTKLYLGRDPIFPGPAGWPIPHDAPFKSQLDRCLMAVVEAGLFDQWNEEIMRLTRLRSQQESLARQQSKEVTESNNNIKALTLIHMQGPFMLLILGLLFAGMAFTAELIV